MTTILSLPEEILLIIFKELWPHSPKECKWVCKAWYKPAHKMDLKDIYITFSKAQSFIASIDHNPDPSYLNAVKRIDIRDHSVHYSWQEPEQYPLSKEMVQKLFCRFPKLKSVTLADPAISYDDLNDEICKTILQSCPQLDKFETHLELDHSFYEEYATQEKQDNYLNKLYKLRLLLTKVDLKKIDFRSRSETPMEILVKFPRLETIADVPELNNFQKLLPVLTELSNIKTIRMEKIVDDVKNFAEMYIATKTEEEQYQLKRAISNINDLVIRYRATFGVKSITFVSKYFIGLKSFSMVSYDNEVLTDLQQKLLLGTIIDLVCSAKDRGSATFCNLKLEDLSRYIPRILPKVYKSTPNNLLVRAFKVKITNHYNNISQNSAYLTIESNTKESSRNIDIYVTDQISLHEILTNFCYKIPSPNDISKFIVDIDLFRQEYNHEISADMYDAIFNTMPSLKEVVLEIPTSYIESQVSSSIVYPLMEKVTLLLTAGERSQAIINELSSRFPKLKQLTILYFCGIWNKESQEYQIEFPEYSVEKLALDVTPIKLDADGRYRANRFIVVHVCLASRNENYLYRIPMDMGWTRTMITESDLNDFKSGEDYYRVRITINDLRRLDIYLRDFVSQFEPRYLRHVEWTPYITLFDNKI